ncbi:hypothetical protein E6O75_ATG03560 [Venturia nashicola]|uniref:Uncharacterized protein n=1 Tax=Venturia nashicola TaxID=86259 RepID=A0A4Z1P8T6_9PEZI|nr:hypothetical protein E6O75_ATG03560 [Venturia nashicola]
MHIIFISQTLNVYAMFLVKASTVAFLMALDLGRSYRIIIWISAPYYSRWAKSVKGITSSPFCVGMSAKIRSKESAGPRVGTSISIVKIPMTCRFVRSKELFSDAIDLSICCLNEVCVEIIIANLPPLRKTILGMLSHVLPASVATSIGASSKNQGGQSHRLSIISSSKRRTILDEQDDKWSDRYILDLTHGFFFSSAAMCFLEVFCVVKVG